MSTRRGFFAALAGLAAACVLPFKGKPPLTIPAGTYVPVKEWLRKYEPKARQIVGVIDGAEARIYVDGELQGPATRWLWQPETRVLRHRHE